MKATLRAAPGAKRKLGNALRWATISCWRVPRLVQSTLPPARIATTLGVSTPSATVTDAPPDGAPAAGARVGALTRIRKASADENVEDRIAVFMTSSAS